MASFIENLEQAMNSKWNFRKTGNRNYDKEHYEEDPNYNPKNDIPMRSLFQLADEGITAVEYPLWRKVGEIDAAQKTLRERAEKIKSNNVTGDDFLDALKDFIFITKTTGPASGPAMAYRISKGLGEALSWIFGGKGYKD